MTSKPFVVFDFDGTIAASLPLLIDLYNEWAEEKGTRRAEEAEYLREKSIRELARMHGVSLRQIPSILTSIQKKMKNEVVHAPPVEGIRDTFAALKKHGYSLGILSSNSEENVHEFLKHNDMFFFDFIYSGSSLFGKDRVLKRLLKDQKIDRSQLTYVGDEIRDIEACRKCAIPVIAVTWGFNSEKSLKECSPTHIARHPKDILKILES